MSLKDAAKSLPDAEWETYLTKYRTSLLRKYDQVQRPAYVAWADQKVEEARKLRLRVR